MDVGPKKDEVVYIRCTEDTKVDFREYAAGYDDYEDAIKDAVRVWRNLPSQFRRRGPPPDRP